MRVTDQITGEHQAFTLTRQGVGLIFPLVPPRSGGTLIFGVTYRKSTTMANESLNTSPLLPTFARAELSFERGEGPWLITEKGERYLDFGAGIAVNALGHAHPHLVKALTDQAQRVWHVSNLYNIPDGERLAQRLVDNTFADHVFFTNSGAEALECAIKMARKYHSANGQPERFRVITFEGAFHGRTLATIAAGGQKKYLEGFGPKVDGFDQVPFGDHQALEAAIGPETAAILIEPIQGEGGVRSVPPQCLRGLRELCDKHGLLLIFRRSPDGCGQDRQAVCLPARGRRARHHGHRKGYRRRIPDGRLPFDARRGQGHDSGRSRYDVRGQSACNGGRQCGARCHPGPASSKRSSIPACCSSSRLAELKTATPGSSRRSGVKAC